MKIFVKKGYVAAELHPCDSQPEAKTKAMLKHCLRQKIRVELAIGKELTVNQEKVIADVANYFSCECNQNQLKKWISKTLLNPNSFKNCNEFIYKLKAIINILRKCDSTKINELVEQFNKEQG